VIASFTSGAGASTLPMIIFSKIKLGVTPDINALATIIICIVGLGITIASWIMLRHNKDKKMS
jgi:putrescine transport system permease protein